MAHGNSFFSSKQKTAPLSIALSIILLVNPFLIDCAYADESAEKTVSEQAGPLGAEKAEAPSEASGGFSFDKEPEMNQGATEDAKDDANDSKADGSTGSDGALEENPSIDGSGIADDWVFQWDPDLNRLISYLDGEPAPYIGWVQFGSGSYYFTGSSQSAASCWLDLDGWKYFDQDGQIDADAVFPDEQQSGTDDSWIPENASGWIAHDNQWYYVTSEGTLRTGWVWDGGYGAWYYLDPSTGQMARGWQTVNGTKFFLANDGRMQTGWVAHENKWYYLAGGGAMRTGWVWDGGYGAWYYLDPSTGQMQKGWINPTGNEWFFCDPSGKMKTNEWILDDSGWHWVCGGGALSKGWQDIDGKWYYLDPAARKPFALTGFHTIGNAEFAFAANCSLLLNQWVQRNDGSYSYAGGGGALAGHATRGSDGRMVLRDAAGKLLTGWQTLSGTKFFADDQGRLHTGWLNNDDAWFYLDAEGKMCTGWRRVSGLWYYLTETGPMKTGWLHDGPDWYYLYPDHGAMVTGWMSIDGVTYWFDGSGRMATGWRRIDGALCFFEPSGAFNNNADPMTHRAQWYGSATDWLIMVDTSHNMVGIYKRGPMMWEPFMRFPCSSGAPWTPTVLGEFAVGDKGFVFGAGYSCYFWTQFFRDYLFHSVLYNQNTWDVQDGRLGLNISHGCIRLDANDAKWIWDNIPRGTKVVTYN